MVDHEGDVSPVVFHGPRGEPGHLTEPCAGCVKRQGEVRGVEVDLLEGGVEPRYPTITGRMKAKRAPIEERIQNSA